MARLSSEAMQECMRAAFAGLRNETGNACAPQPMLASNSKQRVRARALAKVELLWHLGSPSIDNVWLALQQVSGAENLDEENRDAVHLAMVRNKGQPPANIAEAIVSAAGF